MGRTVLGLRLTKAMLREKRNWRATGVVAAGALLLSACSSMPGGSSVDPQYGVSASPRVVDSGKPVPRGGGVYKVGRPYKIAGEWYYPREDTSYDRVGVASWYGDAFHGRRTANGEVFDMNALSAAHPTLPMPTYARVTNLTNGRSVVVRINDRGPFARDREIDLSARVAKVLDFKQQGTAKVRVQYVGRAPLEGDDTWLTTTYAEAGRSTPLPQDTQVAVNTQPTRNARARSVFSLGGLMPRIGWASGFTPDWAASDNRVADAFAAFERADTPDNLSLRATLQTIANDPARTADR